MSLQPCLPLPSRSRKRHRNNDLADNDGNALTCDTRGQMLSGKQKISDLSGMSAMEFIGLVHEESQRLGDVFVAAQVEQTKKEKEEEEEEGEIVADDKCEGNGEDEKKPPPSSPSYAHPYAAAAARPLLPSNDVGISGSLAYLLSDRTRLPRPPSAAHLPTSMTAETSSSVASSLATSSSSQAWISATIDDFSKLRLYLDACVEGQIGGKKRGGGRSGMAVRRPVPPMRAREGWHVYCLGRDEAQGYYQDDDDDDDNILDDALVGDKSSQKVVEPWQQSIPPGGHPPGTALLCQMDQVMVRRVLAHHVSYVCDGEAAEGGHSHSHTVSYAMTADRARWLYGLLARLAKPLHRDDAAVLRRLLRECCVRRAGIRVVDGDGEGTTKRREVGGSTKTAVSLLNTLIAIVGIYFEQGTFDELFCL